MKNILPKTLRNLISRILAKSPLNGGWPIGRGVLFSPPKLPPTRGVRGVLLFLAILTLVTAGILFLPRGESEAWFNDTYGYRRPVHITNGSGGELTDFQVSFTLDTATLISNGKMQSDCDDIRVTDSTGSLIPHWIEESNQNCNNSNTKIWTKVPSVPSSDGEIYVYYGSSTASNGEEGGEVFEVFDDFEDSLISDQWTQHAGGGSITETAGVMRISCASGGGCDWWSGSTESGAYVYTPRPSSGNYVVDTYISSFANNDYSHAGMTEVSDNDNTSFWGPYDNSSIDHVELEGVDADSAVNSTSVSISDTSNTGLLSIRVQRDTSSEYFFKGTSGGSYTTWSDESNVGLFLKTWNSNTGETVDFEYLIVRKYASTEPTTSLSSEEVGPGPAASWKFDEGYGTTAQDSTANNNDGTINGASWRSEDMCISGKCLQFDGTDDYVNTSDSSSLDISDGITVSTWLKIADTPGSDMHIVSKHAGADRGWFISFGSGGSVLNWQIRGEDAVWYSTNVDINNLNLNTWHHVVGVVDTSDSNGVKLYLDGVKISEDTWNTGTTIRLNNSDLYIGSQSGSSAFFDGFLDEVKIYPYARTADEIKLDFQRSSAVKGSSVSFREDQGFLSEGLVGYWSMEDNVSGDAQTIEDTSGNDNDGTTSDANATGMDCTVGAKFGYGCDFDGTDDYVDLGDNFDNVSQLTVSAWVNWDSTPAGDRDIVGKRGAWSSDTSWMLGQDNAKLRIRAKTSTDGLQLLGSTTINTGEWNHYVMVINLDNEEAIGYLDGELEVSGSITGSALLDITDTAQIGGVTFYDDYVDGKIDDVRIYNRALSASEVRDLYKFAPGPVAYWDFDEGSGTSTVNDKSGNGNNGTMNGSMTESDWVSGRYGSALDFDGSDDYINVSYDSSIDIANRSFTISSWVKPVLQTASSSTYFGVFDTNSDNKALHLRVYDTGQVRFGFYFDDLDTATGVMSLNSWNYIAMVYDSDTDTSKIFVNGVEEASGNNGPYTGSTPDYYIGRWRTSPTTENFDGAVDDIRIYNYARTQEQILEDMNAGHPAIGTPIGSSVLDLKFDEGYGTTANDSSPQNNDGTITGASWTNDGKFGKALSFDGSGDYVQSDFDFSSDAITISAWTNPSVSGTQGNDFAKVVAVSDSSQPNHFIQVESDGTWDFGVRDSGGSLHEVNSGVNIIQDTWYHLVLIYDESSLFAYVNGELKGSDVLDVSLITNDRTLVGAKPVSDGDYYNGVIDEVQIYPFAVSSDQVKTLFNQGKQTVLGSTGTDSSGNPSNSSSRSYCIPGDTSTCDPPVGEWLLNEGSGTSANDTSGSGNTGTLNNSPTWTRGKIGKALSFDGSDDYIETASNAINRDSGSISGWINNSNEDPPAHTIFLASSAADSDGYGLAGGDDITIAVLDSGHGTNPNEILYEHQHGSASINIKSGTVLSTDTWYHFTATWDISGSTLTTKLYLDGSLVASGSDTVDAPSTLQDFNRIGATFNSSTRRPFPGLIDQFRIYDYARTPAQIAWEYNKGKPVAHYMFDECEGTTAHSTNDPYDSNLDGTINIGGSGTQTSAGTCSSGSSSEAWANGSSGKINSSLNFDGTDDYTSFSENFITSTEFTISAWAKMTGTGGGSGGQNTIFQQRSNTTADNEVTIVLNGDNGLSETVFNVRSSNGSVQSVRTTAKGQGDWHHYMGVVSDDTIRFYVDGVLVDEVTNNQSGDYTTGVDNRDIGRHRFGSPAGDVGYFNGQIDDVKIFNYALTEQQVKQQYNNGALNFE